MFGDDLDPQEILEKLDEINNRVKKLESAVTPLGLINIFDDYSDIGNSFWLEGYLEDVERHTEATLKANGNYLDIRNQEEADYIKSGSTDDFKISEEALEKMMASCTGVTVRKYLRQESDQIREIFYSALNGTTSIKDTREQAEKLIADRPKGFIYAQRFPEDYEMIPEDSPLLAEIKAYYDNRLVEEQERWAELKDPEVRMRKLERMKEDTE